MSPVKTVPDLRNETIGGYLARGQEYENHRTNLLVHKIIYEMNKKK